jgi:hypothetical protein
MDECLNECNYLRRQYFGSYPAMADVNEEARVELMGHKQPHMTMRYTHLSLDCKQAAVAQLEQLGTGVDTNFPPAESEQKVTLWQVVEK